jgi:hypothetical protein
MFKRRGSFKIAPGVRMNYGRRGFTSMNVGGVRLGGARRTGGGGRSSRPTKAQILAQHWRLRPGIYYIELHVDENDSINLIVKGGELTYQRLTRIADGLIDQNTAAVTRALQAFVMKWDILGDDGKPLPLTKAGVERLGIPMIFGMSVAIANALEIPQKSLDETLVNRTTGKPVKVTVSTSPNVTSSTSRADVSPMLPPESANAKPAQAKSKPVAFALWLVLGLLGGHRYYLGRVGSGVLMTITIGGLGVWWLLDLFLLSGMVDKRNRIVN